MDDIENPNDEQLEELPGRRTDRRIRTPERQPAVKRRSDAEVGDELKVRRVIDSPDKSMAPVEDSMGIDALHEKAEEEIDRRIIASAILGVDITEVYSPERVNEVARKHGLRPGSSMDLTNGWDFTKAEDRRRAWKKIKEEDPYLVIGSPPCTLFSLLQELNINNNKNKIGWMEEFHRRKLEAIEHIDFCCLLYRYQLKRGKHFLHEHPWTARSWRLHNVQALVEDPAVHVVQGHMCQFGMLTHVEEKGGKMGLVKKPTGFMTSSSCIANALNLKCQGGHDHVPLVGGRAAGAQVYPKKLCDAIVTGVIKQKALDASNVINMGSMSKKQLSSFASGICADLRRERLLVQHGGCSSITREGDVNRPVGNWPKDWVDTIHEEEGGDDQHGVRPQRGVEVLKEAMYALVCKNTMWTAWDDVTNVQLNVDDVKAARALEMQYFEKLGVYDRVDRSEIARTGGKLIGTRWVDVNKGDSVNVDCRSRLVGREFNVGRDDALYAATPPLEALRIIVSDAATITENNGSQEVSSHLADEPGGGETHSARKELMVNDVRRAYFYAKIDRDVFVELPAEDPEYGSGKVGKLRLCLYGTRDAAKGWQETLSAQLVSIGFTRGVGHPSVFYHEKRRIKTLVHGDDYVSSGASADLTWFEGELGKAYEIKTQRLGLTKGLMNEGKVLNRTIRATESGWEVEADPRHAELVVEQLGLTNEKAVATPGLSGSDEDDLPEDTPLTGQDVSSFRGVAARCNYLGPDRPDANYAIKECCREMSAPTTGSLRRLKRVGKYLKNFPRLIWRFDLQEAISHIDIFTDADWAGCRRSRKSTSGGVAKIGGHCIKAWAKTQSVVAKSSAESELYSVVKGATEGLGLITLFNDMGGVKEVRLNLDATAAKGILERQGISKVRHIDVNVLWLQQQAARKIVPLIKVPGEENCADLLTKHLATATQQKHVKDMNLEFREGRAKKAAQLHSMNRLDPQGEFLDGGVCDKWSEKGESGRWVRFHRTPRTSMFTPYRIPHGPGKKCRLSMVRETVGIDESGMKFKMNDNWTDPREAHRVMPHRWTGMTTFYTRQFDDLEFGGDQRRQRDRAQAEARTLTSTSTRLSWADMDSDP